MNIKIGRLFIAVVFVLSFTTIGWLAPALYATYAPQEQFIEGETFYAPDTHIEASTHEVCFARTMKQQSTGNIIMEMYLVPEHGDEIRIQATQQTQYFQQGKTTEIISVNLPNDLQAGKYHYKRIYRMELVNSRVVRTFQFQSNTFTVHSNTESIPYCS